MAEKSKMAADNFTILSISTYPFVFTYMSKTENIAHNETNKYAKFKNY